jgi:hypothetical protein
VGFLATVVSFARTVLAGEQAPECRLDLDGGDASTAHHFSPPGVDAVPLPGDVAYAGDDAGAGKAQIVGYQDPKTAGLAEPGEVRLYSRSGPGVMAVELWLKADGSLVARNALGELAIDAAGVVSWTTPLGTNGAATHSHSTPFGPSGPPLPGT